VVEPGTVADAYALLRASIASPDPVLFLEHKFLYRRFEGLLGGGAIGPLGEAAVRKEGAKAVVITYGAIQHRALEALEGLDVAVLDLRTLKPFDRESVNRWVRTPTGCWC